MLSKKLGALIYLGWKYNFLWLAIVDEKEEFRFPDQIEIAGTHEPSHNLADGSWFRLSG